MDSKKPRNSTAQTDRKYRSLIRSQIDLMKVGESLTFTVPFRIPPDPATLSGFSRVIGAYAYRTRREARWTFESFYAVTLKGRPLVGVILTFASRSTQRGSKRRKSNKDDGQKAEGAAVVSTPNSATTTA
jgi:hypothetical protein